MTTKQIWTSVSALSAAALVVVAIILKAILPAPQPAPIPTPIPAPAPLPTPTPVSNVTIAAQKARLALNDGRTAMFVFAATSGTLTAHASVGLDQECNYALLPFIPSPAPMPPTPSPTPVPIPVPPQPPLPQPPLPQPTSNLRVLFTYDPMTVSILPAAQQAILNSPALRTYLEKHCPLESNCASGMCPLTAAHSASYRFLPSTADVSQLPAVWQGIFTTASAKPTPWLMVANEDGQKVIDQTWPGSVAETLTLLKKFGGE